MKHIVLNVFKKKIRSISNLLIIKKNDGIPNYYLLVY